MCNYGYARGRCSRFPEDSAADAVRFSVLADEQDMVRFVYVIEKNHAPAEHGVLEYSVRDSHISNGHTSVLLAAQARAFIESYLRRRVQAAGS
jgi:hypothetical protein